MIFSRLAALSAVSAAVFVVAHEGHFHPSSPLNNEDGTAHFEYVPAPLPASSAPMTNGERLARGLPVLPPRPRRQELADNLSEILRRALPSNVARNLRSGGLRHRHLTSVLRKNRRQNLPSGLSRRNIAGNIPGSPYDELLPRQELPVIYDGIIRVEYAQNRSTAGYLAGRLNRLLEFTLTPDPIHAANVTIHADRLSDEPFDITVENPENPELPFLGAVVGPYSSSAKLGHGSKNHAFLVGSDGSEPNAPPSAGRTTAYGGSARESAIWKIDQLSLEITPHWVNPDDKKPRTFILAIDDYFVLSGDPAALDAAFDVKSAEVIFLLEATD